MGRFDPINGLTELLLGIESATGVHHIHGSKWRPSFPRIIFVLQENFFFALEGAALKLSAVTMFTVKRVWGKPNGSGNCASRNTKKKEEMEKM